MKKLYYILLVAILFGSVSCIQINSHGSGDNFDEKKSIQLYIKNFSSIVQNIDADLVSDDIKIKGDTKGDTYVIVRVSGNGVSQNASIDDLQKRIDKYYDIQIHMQGDNTLLVSAKQKVNIISSSESLSFYFEVHTATTSSVQIKNVSGNIDVDRIVNANVSTVSGDIETNNISGTLQSSSTSGDIKGDNIAAIKDANTVSGDIKLKINTLQNDAVFETTSGNVQLQIPATAAANVDFGSTSGSIKINNIAATNYSSKEENKAIGTFNGGGKSLSVHTVSGDININ